MFASNYLEILNFLKSEWEEAMKEEISIISFQAVARGYIERKRLKKMLEPYYKAEAQIIKVQALWRGRKVREELARQKKDLNDMKRRNRRSSRAQEKVETLMLIINWINYIIIIQEQIRMIPGLRGQLEDNGTWCTGGATLMPDVLTPSCKDGKCVNY